MSFGPEHNLLADLNSSDSTDIVVPVGADWSLDEEAVDVPVKHQRHGRRALLLGSAALGAAAMMEPAGANDTRGNTSRAEIKRQLVLVQRHENSHVEFLVNSLGSAARPKPTFQNLRQPTLGKFLTLSRALENTGVGAYLGAAPALNNPAFLAAAGSIALIEARHAGYFNGLQSMPMTENLFGQELDFERAFTVQEVLGAAGPFVASLNGGPPLTFSATRSDSNDIAILNFALALEYLEAEFYNINVPRFFN